MLILVMMGKWSNDFSLTFTAGSVGLCGVFVMMVILGMPVRLSGRVKSILDRFQCQYFIIIL